jgi:hypothetical protein
LGRTVLLIVAQWFVRDARETIGGFLQVRAALRGRNTLLPGVDIYVVGYKGVL